MLETDLSSLKAIQTKLQNLVAVVVAKATEDPVFAHELGEVLLSESLKKKPSKPLGKSKKSHLNTVSILHNNGENGLTAELEMQTDDELRRLARAGGLFKGREIKSIQRAELLKEILSSAKRRLTQGESFLKSS